MGQRERIGADAARSHEPEGSTDLGGTPGRERPGDLEERVLEERAPAVGTAGPRALVVDANPDVRRRLARCLAPELIVYTASSLGEALELVDEMGGADLAFVELNLPDGSGERILERLARWPDGIRVLLWGELGPREPERASSAGPFTFGSSAAGASGTSSDLGKCIENRALVNLVLGKPVGLAIVEALKRATLGLPRS
jgi:CheY-like chemotaxis protein